MRVLLLTPDAGRIWPVLSGTQIELQDTPLTRRPDADLVISYNYRHIVPEEFITERMINIHISFLPWNRGADPNFWSWLDHTPKGVSIHQIDKGIDTGPIICQREVTFGFGPTLRSTYERLQSEAVDLFKEEWAWIKNGWYTAVPQSPGGSFHRKKDMDYWRPYLSSGWDTPIYEIESLRHRAA